RAHFLRYAGCVMRSVIVDFIRERAAQRRGGQFAHVPLDTEICDSVQAAETEILSVHEALDELQQLDERMARIVELRYFADLSEGEICEALGISPRTARRDWQKAQLLLAEILK